MPAGAARSKRVATARLTAADAADTTNAPPAPPPADHVPVIINTAVAATGWPGLRKFIASSEPIRVPREIFAVAAMLAIVFACWPVLLCHAAFGFPE